MLWIQCTRVITASSHYAIAQFDGAEQTTAEFTTLSCQTQWNNIDEARQLYKILRVIHEYTHTTKVAVPLLFRMDGAYQHTPYEILVKNQDIIKTKTGQALLHKGGAICP